MFYQQALENPDSEQLAIKNIYSELKELCNQGACRPNSDIANDTSAIKTIAKTLIEKLTLSPPDVLDDVAEAMACLKWLLQENFTFLGHTKYNLVEHNSGTYRNSFQDKKLVYLLDARHCRSSHIYPFIPTPGSSGVLQTGQCSGNSLVAPAEQQGKPLGRMGRDR
ncbi:NAD-glutamate dehydrogenase [Exilibacterium tricleocarpae]|uniref:NAD-glutamate dehydrogenase n=1 Tax=Exilibacterium tricleocarpae TaxID=2591008 RepID=A0A545SY81_9GAMM|nr:NAD-glutamate dehydrogenase domain-containing protein [Exilibacterium tricleocarpae]TQV69925.1 NAD-glutamate dehydrogenase [Exilibacterium tricleocarpae]